MRKKRGYVRQLRRELENLKEDNQILRNVLNRQVGCLDECFANLTSIRRRIRVLQCSKTYNLDEMKVREYSITTEEIKKSMVEELLNNEAFIDMIKVESDENYVGIGSRVNFSIEVLTPQ